MKVRFLPRSPTPLDSTLNRAAGSFFVTLRNNSLRQSRQRLPEVLQIRTIVFFHRQIDRRMPKHIGDHTGMNFVEAQLIHQSPETDVSLLPSRPSSGLLRSSRNIPYHTFFSYFEHTPTVLIARLLPDELDVLKRRYPSDSRSFWRCSPCCGISPCRPSRRSTRRDHALQ